ncbi:molecular chaperone DnaJ [bacterium]|nr:molecular chaperone DnaJ [bacterium]
MEEITKGRFPCAHCQGSGTCSSGKDGESCAVCIKEGKAKTNSFGLVCSVCGGIGIAELKTDRINRRVTPVLAIFIAYFALFIVFWFGVTGNKLFSEVLAFSATLTGSITGYYFSRKIPEG